MSDIEEFDSGPGSKTLGLVPHLVMYNLKFICKFACFTLHYRLYMFQISKRKVKKKSNLPVNVVFGQYDLQSLPWCP